MNEKNLVLILGLIILIALVGFASTHKQSSTGMVVPGTPIEKPMLSGAPAQYWHEVELTDNIYRFFGTEKFIFPDHPCGRIADELIEQLKHTTTTGMETFTAGDNNKFETIIFKDRTSLGKITLIQGFETPEAVQFHATTRKIVITIDGWKEIMDLEISLKGTRSENTINFEKGKISASDFECQFE